MSMIELGPYEAFWAYVITFFIASLITVLLGWILSNKRASEVKTEIFDCGQKAEITPHKVPIFGSIRYFAYAMAFFVLDAFVWIILSSIYPFKLCRACTSLYLLTYIVIILVALGYYITRLMEVFEK